MIIGTAENQGSGLMQFRTFAKISRAVWLKIGREQAAAEFRGDITTGEEELRSVSSPVKDTSYHYRSKTNS